MSVSNLINRFDQFDSSQQQKPDSLSQVDAKTNKVALEILTPKEERLLRKWQEKYQRKENPDRIRARSQEARYIFRDIAGIDTLNRAKIDELAKYIIQARIPFEAEKFQELASKHNVEPVKPTFKVPPFNKGVCHGAVVEWLNTQNHQDFKGGMPIQAVNLQYIYKNYHDSLKFDSIKESLRLISQMLDNPTLEKNNKDQLEKRFGKSYVELYTIFKNFLNDQSFPDDELFYDLIHNVFTDEPRKELFSTLYEYHSGHQIDISNDLNATKFSFALSNLDLKEVIHRDATGMDLINSLSALKPGLYYIVVPVFQEPGKMVGTHALGLKIENDSFAFFDPNYRIVESDKAKLKSMMIRNILNYSGIDIELLNLASGDEKREIAKAMGSHFSLYQLERKGD